MAEGLDLAGDLANEVVITRLPFQPPDDPREATLAEYLKNQGRDPFRELSLPCSHHQIAPGGGPVDPLGIRHRSGYNAGSPFGEYPLGSNPVKRIACF